MAIPLSPGIYPFGSRPDGQAVQQVVLCDGTLGVAVLSHGAILQDVRLDGVPYGLTVGTDTLPPYLGGMSRVGSLIGPVSGPISNGAAVADGQPCRLERDPDGKHPRDSGAAGTQHKLWDVVEASDTAVTLEVNLRDGDGGFPGNRAVAARYSLPEPGTLEVRIAVTSDRATLVNFASHAYWTLDGTETFAGHRLRVAADRLCLSDADGQVTGEVAPVADSAVDFRSPRVLTPGAPPLRDIHLCLADKRRTVTEVLTLTGASGVSMTIATTEPGLRIDDGADLANEDAMGHDGRGNGAFCGLGLAPQGWPDAPSHSRFPQITLPDGRAREQVTRFRFARG